MQQFALAVPNVREARVERLLASGRSTDEGLEWRPELDLHLWGAGGS
jgi:hypothetical protein